MNSIAPRKLVAWKQILRRTCGDWTRAARRIVGIPDYDAYIAHLRARHPERTIPTRAAFFAERQRARYRGGGGRCC